MTRSITLRLPKGEYDAFTAICIERGYSKTGKIREFIRSMVKDELESVTISAKKWGEIEAGIKEIQDGHFVGLEDLKRGYAEKVVASKKGGKSGKKIS
jgi:low affinity Fe/Cu permease